MDDKMREKWDRGALVAALETIGVQFRADGKTCLCPFHEDHHASAGIFESESGWRFKCHSCGVSGDVFDMRARLMNCSPADLLRRRVAAVGNMTKSRERDAPMEAEESDVRHAQRGVNGRVKVTKNGKVFSNLEDAASRLKGLTAENIYRYTNPESGVVDLAIIRFRDTDGKKTFRQLKPQDGGFAWGKPDGLLPLYNRARIAKSNAIVVCEGEKCCHALHGAGFVATTSSGGAGKAGLTDWLPLAGKHVYLWPDFDEPGLSHMSDVRKIIEKLKPAPKIYYVSPECLGLDKKGDAADYLLSYDADETRREAIAAVLSMAKVCGPAGDLEQILHETIHGLRKSLPSGWPIVDASTRMLLPGTVTILCGSPGASKSFMALQMFAKLHADGIPIALFELEEDRAYHLQRLLAQLSGSAYMCDPDWIERNPDLAIRSHSQHAEFLDSFGRRIDDAPSAQMSFDAMSEWVCKKCEDGARVLGIDPITAAAAGKAPWEAADKFMMRVKPVLAKHRASLVIVSHPRKGGGGGSGVKTAPDMDSLAGGAGFARFSQTILFLEHLAAAQNGKVRDAWQREVEGYYNRKLRILKSRNAVGHGRIIAFYFDGGSLSLSEVGGLH